MENNYYDIFDKEEDRKIAEKIWRRTLQVFVHSYLYYECDENLIDDYAWSMWATELYELRKAHPEIASKLPLNDAFDKDYDGSSGQFLDYKRPEITQIGNRLLYYYGKLKPETTTKKKSKKKKEEKADVDIDSQTEK